MASVDYYQRLTERFTLDNHPLLLAAAASYAIGYTQYLYAIRLTLREGRSPMPFWMHSFYLAHDSTWSYVLGSVAPRYDNHWFLRGTSTALFVWATLEIFCIYRAITKDRDANFASILGPGAASGPVLCYCAFMQLGMYSIVVLMMRLMGKGCLMQWFCLTNVLIVVGPTHEYLRRGSRDGLALGFCLTNIIGTVWTFAPFGFWVLTIPEIFDNSAYYLVGVVLCLYSVWAFAIVAKYPPKKQEKNGPAPICKAFKYTVLVSSHLNCPHITGRRITSHSLSNRFRHGFLVQLCDLADHLDYVRPNAVWVELSSQVQQHSHTARRSPELKHASKMNMRRRPEPSLKEDTFALIVNMSSNTNPRSTPAPINPHTASTPANNTTASTGINTNTSTTTPAPNLTTNNPSAPRRRRRRNNRGNRYRNRYRNRRRNDDDDDDDNGEPSAPKTDPSDPKPTGDEDPDKPVMVRRPRIGDERAVWVTLSDTSDECGVVSLPSEDASASSNSSSYVYVDNDMAMYDTDLLSPDGLADRLLERSLDFLEKRQRHQQGGDDTVEGK
ncbi:hypothetical protein ACJZ2D_016186 [Fusarium nematophilum]